MDDWFQLKTADHCDVCQPRPPANDDHLEIAGLSISSLCLLRNQRFPGYSLLIFNAYHATSLAALSQLDYERFMADLRLSAAALQAVYQPDHMNFECLGNRNPHLHWHIVPRYRDDPRWGYPIWETEPPTPADPRTVILTETEYAEHVVRIRAALGPAGV